MNIEVEIKSFITPEKYAELIEFFKKEGEMVNEDYQETYYFDCEEDIRIQKNNFFSKIVGKKGKVHDTDREETEIKFDKDDFEKLEKLFLSMGINVDIKWFRNRHAFKWQDIDVMVDYTKGYGHILELEKMSTEEGKDATLAMLKEKLALLNIPLTPREEFEKKFKHYKENWRELTG